MSPYAPIRRPRLLSAASTKYTAAHHFQSIYGWLKPSVSGRLKAPIQKGRGARHDRHH